MADSSFAAPLAFPFGGSTVNITTLCDVWAQDLIAVTFQEPLANDIYMQDILAYKVTPLDGGTPVDVVEAQTGNQSNTSTVWLVVTPPQIGKTYQITFQNLYAITGLVITPNPCNFIGRTTKEDSIINSRPQMYDMRPDSNIRKLLQAIGRQDDLIGGSRSDYFTSPLPAPYVVPVVVTPNPASVPVNGSQTFSALVDGGAGPQDCTWFVNDIPLGNSTVGTLTILTPSSVKYNAPALVPSPATVTVKAVSNFWGAFGTAAVTVTP